MPSKAISNLNMCRNESYGWVQEAQESLTIHQIKNIYRKAIFTKYFELEVAKNINKIEVPIYLSVGQEHIAATISEVFVNPLIFGQHRSHPYYLSYGANPISLKDELLSKHTGCTQGKGGSASIHDREINMFGHSGLMGDQVPIAVGAALASNKNTLSITGDASVEEDYVFGAFGYAKTKNAKVLFICEDNNFSILTPISTRRSWNMVDVASSLGMPSIDISDDPFLISHYVNKFKHQLPAFINIRTCRHLWHAGVGNDGPPEWNRSEIFENKLDKLNLKSERQKILKSVKKSITNIWKK